ncbi:MAG: cytochrome P450 [Bryobacteraceae bacterium]
MEAESSPQVTSAAHENGVDRFSPAPPEDPHFRPESATWVLSRYEQVLAALREPGLWPTGPLNSEPSPLSDPTEQLRVRAAASEAFSAAKVAQWQAQIEPLARTRMNHLERDRHVDLIREFARPWSLDAATTVTGVDTISRELLADLARQVSAAAAEPNDAALQSEAAVANAELETILQGSMPMRASVFVALSQGLPCFLASAWLALLQNPLELERLRLQPTLMPGAIEELLRYAGLARSLFRRATKDVTLGPVTIAEGHRVMLMLDSANRDPAQFAEPNRLDLGRRVAGQLAFGAGPHSCVGALLIRMAAAVATNAFVQNVAGREIIGPIEWRGGSGFRWPASLNVRVQSHRSAG